MRSSVSQPQGLCILSPCLLWTAATHDGVLSPLSQCSPHVINDFIFYTVSNLFTIIHHYPISDILFCSLNHSNSNLSPAFGKDSVQTQVRNPGRRAHLGEGVLSSSFGNAEDVCGTLAEMSSRHLVQRFGQELENWRTHSTNEAV